MIFFNHKVVFINKVYTCVLLSVFFLSILTNVYAIAVNDISPLMIAGLSFKIIVLVFLLLRHPYSIVGIKILALLGVIGSVFQLIGIFIQWRVEMSDNVNTEKISMAIMTIIAGAYLYTQLDKSMVLNKSN